MADFKKLELYDINKVREYFKFAKGRICDNAPLTMIMWRRYFAVEYAIIAGCLVMSMRDPASDEIVYMPPIGEAFEQAIRELCAIHCENGVPLLFAAVAEEYLEMISTLLECEAEYNFDWCDYLYLAEDFIGLAGGKYHAQRNHISRFKRENPTAVFSRIDETNISLVRMFFKEHFKAHPKDSALYTEERQIIFELLDNFELYGLCGGMLADGDKVIGFSLGEVAGDTLYVHIEKSSPEISGSYQMLAHEFAKCYATEGITYINREEDIGDPGLRKAKEAYHPCALLKKYNLRALPRDPT